MDTNPYEAPWTTGSRLPHKTRRHFLLGEFLLVGLAIAAVLVGEVLLIDCLYWARVTTFTSEPGRFRFWEPLLGSDVGVFFLAPLASTFVIGTLLGRSLRLIPNKIYSYGTGYTVAAVLSSVAWVTALTITINKWGA
jgi:hypothetical protein